MELFIHHQHSGSLKKVVMLWSSFRRTVKIMIEAFCTANMDAFKKAIPFIIIPLIPRLHYTNLLLPLSPVNTKEP